MSFNIALVVGTLFDPFIFHFLHTCLKTFSLPFFRSSRFCGSVFSVVGEFDIVLSSIY